MLDPDPESINPDPKHWAKSPIAKGLQGLLLFSWFKLSGVL
jgi:hypothetical protein